MHNIILLSDDAKYQKQCTQAMAQQLLHHGLARITKFYPYTLQLKQKPQDPKEPFGEAVLPRSPLGNPPMNAKRIKLCLEEVV